jgi:hypothetical protein
LPQPSRLLTVVENVNVSRALLCGHAYLSHTRNRERL